MDLISAVCATALILRIRKKRRQRKARRCWVNALNSQRFSRGFFYKNYQELREQPENFLNYYGMTVNSFDKLLKIVQPFITFNNTQFRKCIPPEERLSVTLRYLVSGNSIQSLHFEYLIGLTTLCEMIEHTCKYLWIALKPIYMEEKTKEDWVEIANVFFEKTKFPNCIGAIDGKYIPVEERAEIHGADTIDSLELLAVADADNFFISIDVGAYGSDSSVFKNSKFGKSFTTNQLNLPESAKIPNYEEGPALPFVFVGDEAFPLSENLMRPFPSRKIDPIDSVFNERLSRARKAVEDTFVIMTYKWRILHRKLNVKSDFCEHIIKACCILHNFVRKHDGKQPNELSEFCRLHDIPPVRTRASIHAMGIRRLFTDYFTSPNGALSCENDPN